MATTWLWAPYLNDLLSYRTTLISQYETSFQPYSWLFRSGDLLAGCLVFLAGIWFLRRNNDRWVSWLLVIIGGGMILDPVLATSCTQVANTCQEYFSTGFLFHAIETVITALAFFCIGLYDAYTRRRVVSIAFFVFQLFYGLLFASQLANQQHFNTLSQYVYQLSLVIWLAWFVRDYLKPNNYQVSITESVWVKNLVAAWAFLNGIFAILISLAHIEMLGKLKAFYFAGDSAWLAQHGVIVGVIMLYLSRHLARGERRARQIFLFVLGLETLKYSLVSPHAALLALYIASFAVLFVLRDDFRRGTVPLTRRMRLVDLYVLVVGLLIAIAATVISLDRDNRVAGIAARAFDHFTDYITNTDTSRMSHLRSILLDQTLLVFFAASVAVILWTLFRPAKTLGGGRDYHQVNEVLNKHSNSSEDFFKLWPRDKDFFWSENNGGFIAYKRVGATAFGLADPIGANQQTLIHNFIDWSHGRRLKVCFLPVYEKSTELYKSASMSLLKIGSSAIVDTATFIDETANNKWWRWVRNKAKRAGYQYSTSSAPHSAELLKTLRVVSDNWQKVGGHTERTFALGYFNEHYLNQCTIHYLTAEDGRVIAFANELPRFNSGSVGTIDMMRYLPDYDHSMPYLLYEVISSMRQAGIKKFDLGFVPFARAKGPIQIIAQQLADRRFSFKGLEQFKNKFEPEWQPNYLAYDGDLADLGVIALNIERVMEL